MYVYYTKPKVEFIKPEITTQMRKNVQLSCPIIVVKCNTWPRFLLLFYVNRDYHLRVPGAEDWQKKWIIRTFNLMPESTWIDIYESLLQKLSTGTSRV